MYKLGTETFTGKSGKTYAFNAYPGSMRFNDFIPGVYLMSKHDGARSTAVYLGETDNVDIALKNHEKRACFEENGHNRTLFLRNASREVREAVVADLLPTLKPQCND